MTEVASALQATRTAVEALIAAAEGSAAVWTTHPPSSRKVVPFSAGGARRSHPHEGAKVVAGKPSKFPRLPFFLRPLMRGLFFRRVLGTGRFARAKTNKAMDPETGPTSPSDARARLNASLAAFERACQARAEVADEVSKSMFGPVPPIDYVRFTELHTLHHLGQMPQE